MTAIFKGGVRRRRFLGAGRRGSYGQASRPPSLAPFERWMNGEFSERPYFSMPEGGQEAAGCREGSDAWRAGDADRCIACACEMRSDQYPANPRGDRLRAISSMSGPWIEEGPECHGFVKFA
ncbi:MAG: hypothetical protein WAP03_08385 [Methylorubrum rhodinum]|uniref:hypothetical protein n=1 Tax=Methylorubrum rhodinum TaxID=29428 RepID=UPI003BB0D6BF